MIHGARKVRLFSSVARGDARPTSDVDFLIDLEPGRSLLDQVGLQQDLEQLLNRRVDVVVEGGLSPYLEKRILAGEGNKGTAIPADASRR
ncbi:MAG: nucleotidyltransferase family protein [Planctomycetes bacterium]|nr:nucleotidyltransferase family protein [Planctomycetota bacterium]